MGLIPGSGRCPEVGNGNPLWYSAWKIRGQRKPGGLHSKGLQRVVRDWALTHLFPWIVYSLNSLSFCVSDKNLIFPPKNIVSGYTFFGDSFLSVLFYTSLTFWQDVCEHSHFFSSVPLFFYVILFFNVLFNAFSPHSLSIIAFVWFSLFSSCLGVIEFPGSVCWSNSSNLENTWPFVIQIFFLLTL